MSCEGNILSVTAFYALHYPVDSTIHISFNRPQHDNYPKHTCGVVQRHLANKKVNVIKWPAQSSDLNPLENLWVELNRISIRKPKNEDE